MSVAKRPSWQKLRFDRVNSAWSGAIVYVPSEPRSAAKESIRICAGFQFADVFDQINAFAAGARIKVVNPEVAGYDSRR